MQEASRKDISYLVYQFEVKSLGNVYSNDVSGENLTNLTWADTSLSTLLHHMMTASVTLLQLQSKKY